MSTLKLSCDKYKGLGDFQLELDSSHPIAYLTGPNGAGKSAVIEAVLEAITGKTTTGASQQKLCMIRPKDRSLELSIDGSIYEHDKCKAFPFVLTGSLLESVTGADLWKLMADESLSAQIEKAADLKNKTTSLSKSLKSKRDTAQALLAELASTDFPNESIDDLKKQKEAIGKRIDAIRKHARDRADMQTKADRTKRLLENIEENISVANDELAKTRARLSELRAACEQMEEGSSNEQALAHNLISLVASQDPKTVKDAVAYGCEAIRIVHDFLSTISEEYAKQASVSVPDALFSDVVTTECDRPLPLPSANSILNDLGIQSNGNPALALKAEISTAESAEQKLLREINVLSQNARAEKDRLHDLTSSIEAIPDMSEMGSLIQQHDTLEDKISKLTKRQSSMALAESLKAEINEAEEELKQAKAAHLEASSDLAKSLGKLSSRLENLIDRVAHGILAPCTIEFKEGARPSVSIMFGQTHLDALSGAEKTVAQASIAYALSSVHECEFSLLAVEAAELDMTNLQKFMSNLFDALSGSSKPTFVLVAHWLPMPIESAPFAKVIPFNSARNNASNA